MKAKRGDIAVCIKHSHISRNGLMGYTAERLTVGKVISVTRDGLVKRVKPFSEGCDMCPRDWDSVELVSAVRIGDMEALETECRKRQSLDASAYDPWLSVSDICRAIRKYVKI